MPKFLARLGAHEPFAEVARALLAGGEVDAALKRLRKLAPGDAFWKTAPAREALLDHLASRYGLSARLVRNRRVKVGAFTRRVLLREKVAAGGKLDAAVALCARLARVREKVLVFGGDLEALRTLLAALAGKARLEALLYDDAPTLEARDRLVARFRDPEGPMVLLCGESGGEGRNFQFASHLVCYDLPDSPLVLEQRIGRLDRLGQTRPVEIHVLAEPGEEDFLAGLYEKEIGIFEEPVGGLDTVLASLPEELAALRRKRSEPARAEFRSKLAARVAEGRRAQHEGYDPLLDLRSASIPELTALVRSAFARMGEEPPEEDLEHALQTLSRWLEEELEELTVEIGRRAGLDVDTDENVNPFEAAFTLGAGMKIEALPGMAVPEEPRTHLGSFWRETAVARDELEWLATGHRLVEALLGLARDGDAGRAAALKVTWAPRRGGLYLRFGLAWASPADLAPGARVPSRQASRYLDGAPVSVLVDLAPGTPVLPRQAERLEADLESIDDARVEPPPASLVESAAGAAAREAERVLGRRREQALARLDAHAEAEEERLSDAALAGGASKKAVGAALSALRAHRAATRKALEAVSLELDAAALVVP